MAKKIIAMVFVLITMLFCFVPMTVSASDMPCMVTLTLKDFDTEETDNIVYRLKNKETRETTNITFTKESGWKTEISLVPGEYEIEFYAADNRREVELETEVIEVVDADSAEASLVVKRVLDNNFLPKFFRNNTFTLILLAVAIIAYVILKKKRQSGLPI